MKSSFQIIVIVVFIVLAVAGVLVFSGAIPIGKNNEPGALGTVTLWGTINASVVNPLLEEFNTTNTSFVVKYEQKNPDTLDRDLLEALASGIGPDMLFLPNDLIYHYSDKIYTIPYASYPVSSFKNAYAGAGEVFLNSNGVMAIPMYIDPLVMYYNRSTLDANGIVYPPAYWDEFEKFATTISKKDVNNKLIKSAVALGGYSNINNAKDILSALFIQTGNPIVSIKDGLYISNLIDSNFAYDPASVLKFYTDFADPNKNTYSWNKSFPNSQDFFSQENLAIYFGFASELSKLINKNPNQNFGITSLPQIHNSNTKVTFGRVTGLAVMNSSKNFNTAFTAANLLSSGDFASNLAVALAMPPARRDLLLVKPNDTYSPIFYNSALYAKSFIDPNKTNTNDIFRIMVENVLSNKMTVSDAVRDAGLRIGFLLSK